MVVDIMDKFEEGGNDKKFEYLSNFIIIKHDHFYSRYHHLLQSSSKVKVGDMVHQGQAIASSGNSGYSTGPHLHFDIVDIHYTNVFRMLLKNDEIPIHCAVAAFSGMIDENESLKLKVVCCNPFDAAGDIKNGHNLQGNAVIVKRGNCSFQEKVVRCVKYGARVVILFDGDSELDYSLPFIGDDGSERKDQDSYFFRIPIVFISKQDGLKLTSIDESERYVTIKSTGELKHLYLKKDPDGQVVSCFKPVTKKIKLVY